MPSALRTVVLGTRTSSETKARFAALASKQALSESALLALVVDQIIASNPEAKEISAADADAIDFDRGSANDRVTLRLRPGDRALADARAAARRMKTSSYLTMLVRTHVRHAPVMPPAELDDLKSMAGHLAGLGRQLRMIGEAQRQGSPIDLNRQLLIDVGTTVESVRAAVADVVRHNTISWEAGHA